MILSKKFCVWRALLQWCNMNVSLRLALAVIVHLDWWWSGVCQVVSTGALIARGNPTALETVAICLWPLIQIPRLKLILHGVICWSALSLAMAMALMMPQSLAQMVFLRYQPAISVSETAVRVITLTFAASESLICLLLILKWTLRRTC